MKRILSEELVVAIQQWMLTATSPRPLGEGLALINALAQSEKAPEVKNAD